MMNGRRSRNACLRPRPPAETRILSQVGGYSGVILVQKSVYSIVSKSPSMSKIFPSRIRMYHVYAFR